MGMDTVELVWKIENHFNIRIPNAEAEQMIRVQDFYDVVAKHLSAASRSVAGIEVTINQIIADQAGILLDDITPEKSITSDLGLD